MTTIWPAAAVPADRLLLPLLTLRLLLLLVAVGVKPTPDDGACKALCGNDDDDDDKGVVKGTRIAVGT